MSELVRQLTLSDIIFSGYGYTVGAGVFALMPYIVKNAKNYTWLAFLIGGAISIMTAMSYAKLNIEYPSNDAEYSWIIETFKVDKPKTKKDNQHNKYVKLFSAIVIWAVMILGVTMNSVIIVSVSNFFKNMNIGNIPTNIITLVAVLFPTFLNLLDVKKMSIVNIIVTILTTLILGLIPVFSIFKHPHIKDIVPTVLNTNTIQNIIKAVSITILPYNGYQSVVQMSEEVKNVNNIPKGMLISGVLAIGLYTILSVGLILILGVSNISKSTSPIADAFSIFFGKYSGNIVNIFGILTGFTTLLLSIYSRSRLLNKLSEHNIAPKIFNQYGIGKYFKGIPVMSVMIVGVLSYIFTLLKENSLEFLANITNILTLFVFICVNICVIYTYYYKDKNKNKNKNDPKLTPLINKFRNTPPIYAIIALIILLILFYSTTRSFIVG